MGKPVKNIDNISKYEPVAPEDLSYQQFKLAVWYVKHKILLGKIGFGILVGWCVFSVGYSLIVWVSYLLFGWPADQRMISQQASGGFVDYNNLHPLSGAQNLQLDSSNVFNIVDEKYDFVAAVFNPNPRWLARVKFSYAYGEGETELGEAIVLPQSKTWLAVMGQKLTAYPGEVQIKLIAINWEKINPHTIPDPTAYLSERINFPLNELKFTAASAELPAGRLEFKLANATAYGYWRPAFFLELYNNGALVGLLKLELEKISAGEERPFDLRLQNRLLYVDNVALISAINPFDRTGYLAPGK